MLDWIIQGTHAPFFVAQEKGYFKAEGVTVDAIDAGRGATNVAVSVAGGVYHFGWVDMPSMVRFNAQNPAAPLLAVYVSFDETPLAVITRKAADIRKPADLDGKKIAGGPGTAVHDTISILLKAANGRAREDQLGGGAAAAVRPDAAARRGRRHRRLHQLEHSGCARARLQDG